MTEPPDPRRALPPSSASGRSWWLRGRFGGLRYQAALHIRTLEPEPSRSAAELVRIAGPPAADPPVSRTAVEVWEGEGGAVVE